MGEKKRILLVDDDPAVTELLELRLDNWFEVIVTNDPRDVLPLARAKQPHAVICDIDMPEMDGGEVCRALADDPRTAGIPFLYLTAMVSASEVDDLDGEIGGRPGISKSAPVKEIAVRIHAAIERAGR